VAESGVADNGPLAGLFQVLGQMRTRAGLTQRQIAAATGAGGKHGHKLIARLEAGHVRNPSMRLVLDYLRACRATSQDLAVFLDGFLGSPLPIPARRRRGPRRKGAVPARDLSPEPEDAAILVLRKEAAWWKVRRVVEDMLHQELNQLGAKPMSKERGLAADFGRKVFRILYQARKLRPELRERRLNRCRAWAERKTLPPDVTAPLYEAVSAFFGGMDGHGQLDWLPPLADARHLMLLPPRYRLQTDNDMCRSEYLAQMLKEHEVRETARKPVIEAALNLLRSKGLTDQQIGNYRGIINAFLIVAETTEPGSAARAKRIEEIAHGNEHPYIDQTLLRRVAVLVFTLCDQRR
jgi:transcriptional regulator with XRE-family HTH domain